MRTLLAVVALALIAVPANAKKPEPPGPTIVAYAEGYAVDSDGNLYQGVTANNAPCLANLGARLLGNLFGGPPPSKVVGLTSENGSPYVALENGDVYYWCSYAVPAPGYPVYAGNIFAVAAAARFDVAPLNFAAPVVPTQGDPGSPEMPLQPGAAR